MGSTHAPDHHHLLLLLLVSCIQDPHTCLTTEVHKMQSSSSQCTDDTKLQASNWCVSKPAAKSLFCLISSCSMFCST